MNKLVLIDGNSLLNRAFYATPVFSTTDGRPTNAIFGFVKLMLKVISEVKPEYFIVTFDLKAPTFRHKMYDGYKATRSPMPEELAAQVEPLKALLSAMKVAICQKEGYEADDLIGTLSNKFNVHSYIYTGDRDAYQLVDEKTDVHYTKRGVSDLLKLSKENFVKEIGLNPVEIIDLKALMGDKSDNIPGVAGIGEATAKKLLEQFGCLNKIYENIDEVQSPATKRKLLDGKESAYLSYKLATINRNCDINIKLEDCKTPQSFSAEVRDMFVKFEFKSLLNSVNFDGEPQKQPDTVKYPQIIKIASPEELEPLCKNQGEFFVDIKHDRVSVYYGGDLYDVLVEGGTLLSSFDEYQFWSIFRAVLENPSNKVVFYDWKQVNHICEKHGVMPVCQTEDLSVMHYIADYFYSAKNLKELCEIKNLNYEFSAFAISLIYDEYAQIIKKDNLTSLYEEIEKPLIYVLYNMESTGVLVDRAQLNDLGNLYSSKIQHIGEKIFQLCGCNFNINSPTQLGEILFDKLGLKTGKKNKTGKYSTSAEVLETLAEENEVVRLVLNFRLYQKLYSTYVEGFKPLIDRNTGLVHTTYNQTVTTTGRLSSTNPNLQNIPIREEEGREIRKVFVAKPNHIFIDADYSQIELRLLAHFSGCKELIAAYNDDEDVHAITAASVFGVPIDQVTPKMRREAKAVNFGIIYGISDFGLSKNLGIDIKIARDYIEKYFEKYTAVKEYMDSNVAFAKKNGYVATLTGRKRYIKEINSNNYNLRQFGERAAMNMPLQGSSADIIKIAMVNLFNELKNRNLQTKIILQVHDELVLDAPEEEKEIATELLKNAMENAVKLNVPLKVDVHSGKNWYEAK